MILDTDVLIDIHHGHATATATGAGEELATFNLKHFRAGPGLITVQPYQR